MGMSCLGSATSERNVVWLMREVSVQTVVMMCVQAWFRRMDQCGTWTSLPTHGWFTWTGCWGPWSAWQGPPLPASQRTPCSGRHMLKQECLLEYWLLFPHRKTDFRLGCQICKSFPLGTLMRDYSFSTGNQGHPKQNHLSLFKNNCSLIVYLFTFSSLRKLKDIFAIGRLYFSRGKQF